MNENSNIDACGVADLKGGCLFEDVHVRPKVLLKWVNMYIGSIAISDIWKSVS